MTIKKLLELANQPESKVATKIYANGFKLRMAEREKEFKAQAKAQQWTKANDDFEYKI